MSLAPMPLAERAALFAQLGAMEQAGVPLDRALATVQLPAQAQRRVQVLARLIGQGRDLAGAGLQAGVFTPLEGSLLRAAQAAGSPARMLLRLAAGYEQQVVQARAIKSRLMLPAAVLLLALLIQPLPALVGGTLSLGGYLWGVLQPLLLLAGLLLAGRWWWQRQSARGQQSALLSRLPVLGRALARRNARDYFESLGLLLEAGMPMFDALPRAQATLRDPAMRSAFLAMQQRVLAGQPLAQAMQALEFPGQPQLAALVRTGEASGTVAATLLGYAQRESLGLAEFEEQLATWLPRLVYAAVALWMAYGLLTGAGIGPRLPAELG
ncbi:type II secretion system F family protein [Pseudomonas sp. BMS12]|uniref:type II secretion system F family protein n=1 Tax=Pseudomonas sp. BMS12 TaxID=1796033 RepID=UPI00083A34B6|nr:type II secretion system F family protein [Pseudomonas sp. BMS12]